MNKRDVLQKAARHGLLVSRFDKKRIGIFKHRYAMDCVHDASGVVCEFTADSLDGLYMLVAHYANLNRSKTP